MRRELSLRVIRDPALDCLLTALHARSDEQVAAVTSYQAQWTKDAHPPTGNEIKSFLSDKLVALDRDKAEFCYQLCRANNAFRIVEVGTSYGVSTLYLAAAVRDNVHPAGGVVIGTEYEPKKAFAARANFKEAGLSRFIDLREGDLRETLKQIDGPVDFMLVDIWTTVARPALELVAPHLRSGAIVICDNTERCRSEYADYFAFLNDPANGFRTMTLPFDGGLELSVRC
jgi:predicted O-methyltransferase YrrM